MTICALIATNYVQGAYIAYRNLTLGAADVIICPDHEECTPMTYMNGNWMNLPEYDNEYVFMHPDACTKKCIPPEYLIVSVRYQTRTTNIPCSANATLICVCPE